ncbi:kinase-like domain-containing protein [Cunninghamella echinulata]|nr:kinase-like domain-containing protein [Cunninghamella echinulata]
MTCVVSVFETTFSFKHELIVAFHIVIQSSTSTISLIRYPSDFAEFHQKIRCHYPRTKIPLPSLNIPNKKRSLPLLKASSTTTITFKSIFYKKKPQKSNADKIEEYLSRCFMHPIVSISSLLRDFLSVQREDDKLVDMANSSSIYSPITLSGKSKCQTDTPDTGSSVHHHHQSLLSQQEPTTTVSIDQFNLLKVIGKGCMGKVLLVESNVFNDNTTIATTHSKEKEFNNIKKSNQQLYALKVISKHKVIQQNEVHHTIAERDILARLRDQPFLIKLYHAFQTDSHLYFVLDYIHGGDIATQMSNSLTFTKERTRFYAAEILMGLSILHSHGIIYRDLKPENVLIGRDGHIVLTDFGLSKVFNINESRGMGFPTTGTFCGTAEYLAPEVILGEKYTYSVDYWSLGTLIYEMLAGMTPFWADTHMEMFRRVLEDNLEFPTSPSFDPITCDFLSGLLEKDPYERLGWDSSEQIKNHPYFAGLDWDDVAQRKLKPHYIPIIQSETDLTHFDASFVNMTPRISESQAYHYPTSKENQNQDGTVDSDDDDEEVESDPFRNFSFDPRYSDQSSSVLCIEKSISHPDIQQPSSSFNTPSTSNHYNTQQQRRLLRGKERFSTSSSFLSIGTGEVIRHIDTMPTLLTTSRDTPSLATNVRKRHSAAISLEWN